MARDVQHLPLTALMILLVMTAACSNDSSSPAGSTAPSSGNSTLAGADANGDGVRDDIESYVDQTYPVPAEAGTNKALRQYAKAAQISLLDAGDPAKSIVHITERFRALECLMARRPGDFHPIFVELRSRILNTNARSAAYLTADSHAATVDIPLVPADQWVNQCLP